MSPFRQLLIAGAFLAGAALPAARGAVTLSDVNITNVGTSTFTVVWTTSEESTAGLDVFSDAAGANALTSSLKLEWYPIASGDPAIASDAASRAAHRTLELLAMQRRAVAVRVSGLAPNTTYHVRPRTFGTNGVDNGTGPLPLTPATTAQFNSVMPDARMLRIRIPTFAAQGMILLVQGPAGTTPLSALIGDSTAADSALFSTALLIDKNTGTNPAFTSPQPFVVRVLGAGAPSGTFNQTINFGTSFVVAQPQSIDATIDSPAPYITQQPIDKTVAAGATATFGVVAAGTPPPTYQWQRKPAGSQAWANLVANSTYSGVATATLTVTNATQAMNGDQFRVVVTNGVQPDATSTAATLAVTASAVAPSFTQQPQSAATVAGANVAFTAAATGVPAPTYQWQRKLAGQGTWADIGDGVVFTGTTTASLSITQATAAMNGDQFRVVATNGVLPDATSDAATLTVTAAPVAPAFTTQPSSKTAAPGADVTFSVEVSGTPTPSLKWQIKLAGSGTWIDLTSTPNYLGVTTATLTVKTITSGMSGDQFRAVATNGTAPDATSDTATLTVANLPTITQHPQPTSAPVGSNGTFTVTATGTGALTYQWQRRPAGLNVWQNLANGSSYADVLTGTLKVLNVSLPMSGDEFRCVVTDTIGSTPSNAAALTVTKPAATVALSKLRQTYDGTPRPVSVATVPSGLAVSVTYDGSATAPTVPGTYAVAAQITDVNYAGSATGELVIGTTVLVRHAPTIAGTVDGSIQLASAEATTLTGTVSGDLLTPGVPNVLANGSATMVGTIDGPGVATPTGYSVTLETSAVLRYLVRKVDAVPLPTLATPPAPTGTRNVTLTTAGQTAGDFATVRNLSISGTAGSVTVPAGTYGNLTGNGATTFVLGVAGATEAAVYNLQNLSINPLQSTAKLVVVGPVVINVAGTVAIYGDVGAADHPEWLTLNASAGAVSINSKAAVYGTIVAPNSTVTLNGTSTITGRVTADRVNVTTNAAIKQIP